MRRLRIGKAEDAGPFASSGKTLWLGARALCAGIVSALTIAVLALSFAPQALAQPKPAASSKSSAAPKGSAAPGVSATASASMSAPPAASVVAAVGKPASGGVAPTAGPSTAAPTQPPGQMDGQTYAVRLRDLELKIDELKEQIRRSHTRLSLLSDTILSGGGAGSRSVIKFNNELSSAFRVTRVLVVLDGAVQYNKTDQSGALADQQEIPIFNGSVPPGDHTLQVLVNLQGNGYGVFSYLRGYRFEVRSSHSFTAVEGKTINLSAIAYEKGGVTTPLEQRPAIRYVEKVVAGLADAGPAPAPAAPAAPAQQAK